MPPFLDNEKVDLDSSASSSKGGPQTLNAPTEPLKSSEVTMTPETKLHTSGTFDSWIEAFGPAGGETSTDEDSVSGYFDISDFQKSNWTDAVDYIPPVGIAVACGSLAFCVPATFLIGAVATVGAVHAAATAYESCIDASCSGACTVETADIGVVKKSPEIIEDGLSHKASTMDEGCLPEESPEHDATGPPVISQDPSALQTSQQFLDWAQTYYPPLKHTARENMEFVGLNALEFFEVFFDDDAPYTLKDYQAKRGDRSIQYGSWEKLDGFQQPSLHAAARSCSGLPSLLRERILNFKVKNISPFGPPYVPATKVQRALVASKRLMILESKNSVSGVPLSDRFFVLERWVVTAEKNQDLYYLRVSIHSETFFLQKCPFESQIVAKSESSFKEIANHWYGMAQEALKLTEMTRLSRIHGQLNEEGSSLPTDVDAKDGDDSYPEDQSVEVQHFGRCKSWVVGDAEPPKDPPLKNSNSFGRVSRQVAKFVRRHSSELSFRRSASQSSANI